MNEFFWGGNTGRGSVNFAKEFFPEAKKRILIKGGPGTGKSSFIKRLLKRIENPIVFYCPSAPDSFDTIADFDLGFFVTDATAPHILEAEKPGIRDEILNFGNYWDSSRLRSNQRLVEELSQKNSMHFSLAYACLQKALKFREQLERSLAERLHPSLETQYQKIKDEILNRKLHGKNELGKSRNRFVSAYTPFGFKKLKVPAEKTYTFEGAPTLAKAYLSSLAGIFLTQGFEVLFLIDPLDGMNYEGVYLPELKLHIKVVWPAEHHYTSFERELQGTIKEEERQGIVQLNKAFLVHEDLEKLYIAAMDFDRMEKELDEFTDRLFAD